MKEKKKIAPAAIVAAGLVLLIIAAMSLPLYTLGVYTETREYSYYFGYYYDYDWHYIEYTFFEALDSAFENLDDFGYLMIATTFFLIAGSLVFSILSIFKRKAGIGACLCAGIGSNTLLIGPLCLSNISEPGPGYVLIFLLMIAVMILTIVVAAKKPNKAPAVAAVPVAPVAAMCPNCRNILPVGSVACNVCGTMIAAPTAPVAPAAATQFCAGCGAPLEAGMSFCRSCGRPTPPPVPTSFQ